MTKAIRCFSNVTLLPLPPYSPELNPVEQLWQQIKQRFLQLFSWLMIPDKAHKIANFPPKTR
jgi:transposase